MPPLSLTPPGFFKRAIKLHRVGKLREPKPCER
jgi:hypothetical protein